MGNNYHSGQRTAVIKHFPLFKIQNELMPINIRGPGKEQVTILGTPQSWSHFEDVFH